MFKTDDVSSLCRHQVPLDQRYTHRESKKGDTILLSISLLNIDRFSQFFHRCMSQ